MASPIDQHIDPVDDMFIGDNLHYFLVGESAAKVVIQAMMAADRPAPSKILDLPCGGGRVTRHLRALFPDAALTVSDLDKAKQSFCASRYAAQTMEVAADFTSEPQPQFDLIWVGSLLTHLREDHFRQCLSWLVASLKDGGLLVCTVHGRRHLSLVSEFWAGPPWSDVVADYERRGFGFAPYEGMSDLDVPYGGSLSSAAWVMDLVTARKDVRVSSFHEGGWDNNQDVLAILKTPI